MSYETPWLSLTLYVLWTLFHLMYPSTHIHIHMHTRLKNVSYIEILTTLITYTGVLLLLLDSLIFNWKSRKEKCQIEPQKLHKLYKTLHGIIEDVQWLEGLLNQRNVRFVPILMNYYKYIVESKLFTWFTSSCVLSVPRSTVPRIPDNPYCL